MSAAVLRRAAALMRERAEGAEIVTQVSRQSWYTGIADLGVDWVEDAEHIASWHPAVALAVADWLDAKAEQDDKGTCDDPRGCCNLCEHDYGHVAALAVARAYLGESA